jgi:hypothetical protein
MAAGGNLMAVYGKILMAADRGGCLAAEPGRRAASGIYVWCLIGCRVVARFVRL